MAAPPPYSTNDPNVNAGSYPPYPTAPQYGNQGLQQPPYPGYPPQPGYPSQPPPNTYPPQPAYHPAYGQPGQQPPNVGM